MKWSKGVVEWFDDDTINISVVFTWDMEEAWQRAMFWHSAGYQVRVGGPGVHVKTPAREALRDIAKIGGTINDAVIKHNPSATFASRGCPVGCWFCIVPSLEGSDFTLIDNFTVRPILCDNNLSALPLDFQKHIVDRYIQEDIPLMDAQSGFEPRTFTEEIFEIWKPIMRGPWRFAIDDQGDVPHAVRVLDMLRCVKNPKKKRVYVLIGNEPFEQCMDRINLVLDYSAEPHVQPLIKLNAMQKKYWVRFDWTEDRLRNVARWANRRLFKYTDFNGYIANKKSSHVDNHTLQLDFN